MANKVRTGFTLIELIVCALIIFVLAALIIPATGSRSRESSRRNACLANEMQLAKAQEIFATSSHGKQEGFRGFLEPLRIDDAAASPDDDPATPSRELIVAWPVRLLPVLESTPFYGQLLSGDKNFNIDAPPPIEIFNCPSDPPADMMAGGFGYVVNSGIPDLEEASETQPSDLAANGVCHDQRPGRFGPKVTRREIKDGQNCTILLSENNHRDPAGSAQRPGNTWLRPAPNAVNSEQWYGMVWLVDPQNPRSPRAELAERFNRDTRPKAEWDQPYAASGTRFARPSSNHPGVFNVVFCGGNAKAVDESIDYAVYQQLMTPNGAKAAPADAPDKRFEKTLPDDQRFMNPPLADDDF